MTADQIMKQDDFRKCLDFHGHFCPGLAIGYRAGKAAMDWLKERRAPDEEMVATVQTNACGTDALQVLTGCTLGKGNLLCEDHGKHVYTLVNRKNGNGVRIALRHGALVLSDRHRELIQKIREDTATPEEKAEFQKIHTTRGKELLEKPLEALFTIRETQSPVPEKAMIEPSIPCDRCGEPTMASKLMKVDQQSLCRECAAQ